MLYPYATWRLQSAVPRGCDTRDAAVHKPSPLTHLRDFEGFLPLLQLGLHAFLLLRLALLLLPADLLVLRQEVLLKQARAQRKSVEVNKEAARREMPSGWDYGHGAREHPDQAQKVPAGLSVLQQSVFCNHFAGPVKGPREFSEPDVLL